jgi:hypothetical protein
MKELTHRHCTGCDTTKEITEFTKDKYDETGYTYRCKKCRAEVSLKWNKANPEKVKEANLKNREKRKAFYSSPEGVLSSRRAHLKRMFGLSLEDYDIMSEKQNHQCAICGRPEMNNKNKVLCVDHNHTTGEIRALLCGLCNSGLGKFLENKQLLMNAIKYIETYESSTTG